MKSRVKSNGGFATVPEENPKNQPPRYSASLYRWKSEGSLFGIIFHSRVDILRAVVDPGDIQRMGSRIVDHEHAVNPVEPERSVGQIGAEMPKAGVFDKPINGIADRGQNPVRQTGSAPLEIEIPDIVECGLGLPGQEKPHFP